MKFNLLTMSHLQGVVFIAVLCAVNAAVTVNVYEDDVEIIRTNKDHEVESCNNEACDRICRLVGFNSGICVGDTCECRKSLKDGDQLNQNGIHSLDEGVSGTELGGCDPLACYQLCRHLMFPSGTCVNGRCKCDNFRQESEKLTEAMDNGVPDQVHAGCTNSACSTLCHILGYRYGMCINSNTCRCSNALRTDVLEISLDRGINEYISNAVEPNVDNVPNTVRDCDQLACTMGCLELGAPGGSCSLGKCRCNKRGGEEETKTSSRSCISVICTQQCLQSNHLGGRCRNGRCECF